MISFFPMVVKYLSHVFSLPGRCRNLNAGIAWLRNNANIMEHIKMKQPSQCKSFHKPDPCGWLKQQIGAGWSGPFLKTNKQKIVSLRQRIPLCFAMLIFKEAHNHFVTSDVGQAWGTLRWSQIRSKTLFLNNWAQVFFQALTVYSGR